MSHRDSPVTGDTAIYRPQNDEEWATWLDNRNNVRENIRSRFCLKHAECRNQVDTLFEMLGLDTDRWGVETHG